MRNSSLPERLRQARRSQGLSQAALAARSRTARVTIARLEAGTAQDFRAGTLARLCGALDLELAAVPRGAEAAHETRLARERERSRRMEARLRHAALAAQLLAASPSDATERVRRARANVDRWERERLCSKHYIARWRALLAGPVRRVALRLLDHGEWTDALFQNSPWTVTFDEAR